MQKSSFIEKLNFLKNPLNKNPPDFVRNLNSFIDAGGLIKTGERLNKNEVYDYNLLKPILLSKKSQLTKLFILQAHEKCKHLGINSTLTMLRLNGFWCPKTKQCIKNTIGNCFVCKKFNALSFKYPKVTNLPRTRVNLVRPYKETGIDYTGHVWVKNSTGITKNYLLIFTCLNIRSVHIEIVPDMTTQSFINALIRFANLYGFPTRIYSDNARSFSSALGSNIIENHVNTDKFSNEFQVNNIKHVKIPIFSPWVGSI